MRAQVEILEVSTRVWISTSYYLDWILQNLVELLLSLYLAITEKALQPDTLHVISYIYEYIIVTWY